MPDGNGSASPSYTPPWIEIETFPYLLTATFGPALNGRILSCAISGKKSSANLPSCGFSADIDAEALELDSDGLLQKTRGIGRGLFRDGLVPGLL